MSNTFQDVGQAIRAGDPRIHQINVSRPDFLAWLDLPPVDYPLPLTLATTTVPREGIVSSRLSLEAEIDQFQFEEEREAPERPMELSGSKADLDRFSTAQSPQLIIARVNTSSEEEEEMALNLRRGLRDLVAGRKGGPSKDVPKTQLPPNPTLPPLPSPLGLLLDPNLQKRKRKGKEIEEGEFAPPNDSK